MNVLISACLLGINCRYDGKSVEIKGVEELRELCNLIPVCPEIYGGLPTPRIPSERVDDKVLNRVGQEVTENFFRGGENVLKIARLSGCRYALLKEKSPSCGSEMIYDGSFSGKLTEGMGVTAELLRKNGITVFSENRIDELIRSLKACGG